MKRENLTDGQLDEHGLSKYAIYLPALSSFYTSTISNYVDPARIPANFENGVDGMNWFLPEIAYFSYKWTLYSAGHAKLDLTKDAIGENMVRNRDKNTSFLLMDSGGYQIATGKWPGDWKANSGCPKAMEKRDQVLTWIDEMGDYGMILDIPTWVTENPKASAACQITTYQEAVDATKFNNEYFIKNRKGVKNGGAKLLNVLQGITHSEAEKWYQTMKQYNDPNIYPDKHFDGWSFGGQNASSPTLMLKRIVSMIHDGVLEEGKHDWVHMLGVSRIEWGLLCTDVQKAVRKYHNKNFTISFDSASPFLATANGQIYTVNEYSDKKRWTFKMDPGPDNKKYSTDSRLYKDAVLQDKFFTHFENSPIIDRCKIGDVCYYKPGMLNKLGKEGRTSWDTFSYAIQMAHNVYKHIVAIQESNRLYETKTKVPSMLIDKITGTRVSDIIDQIFSTKTRDDAFNVISHYDKILSKIVGGSKGYTGKKEINPVTQFQNLFDGFETPTLTPIKEVTPASIVTAQFDTLFSIE